MESIVFAILAIVVVTGAARRGRASWGVWLIAASTACGNDRNGSEWIGEVVDSAGVRIVVSSGPGLWEDGGPALEEVLRFGRVSGGGPEEFGNIVGLDVDAAGRIHVLDQQAQEVRVFEADGTHVRTLGGPGAGPGELSASLMGVLLAPDGTVRIPDVGNARINLYGPDGASIGSIPLRIEHGVPIRWDATSGGALVAQLRNVIGSTTTVEGASATRDPLVRFAPDGAVADTLAFVSSGASVTVAADGVPRITLFMPEPIWDLSESGALVTAMNSEYRVEMYRPDGTLGHVLVRPGQRRPVTEGEKERLRRLIGEMMLDQGVPPTMAERITRETMFAETHPVLASILARPDGEVWVQRVRSLDAMASDAGRDFDFEDLGDRHWDVFDPEGRYLGVLSFPERFTLMKVMGDRVFGVARDGLGVQQIVGMRLTPG